MSKSAGICLIPICSNCKSLLESFKYNEDLVSIADFPGVEDGILGTDIRIDPGKCPNCGAEFTYLSYPNNKNSVGPVCIRYHI